MPKVISKKTWLLTADRTRAVPEGHLDGALLLVAAGCETDAAELERYNIAPDGSSLVLEINEDAPAVPDTPVTRAIAEQVTAQVPDPKPPAPGKPKRR